ncbi:hypothetical protein ACOZDZ_21990 [Streptomyces griseoincarnatus]
MSDELPARCCGCVGALCCRCGEAPCPVVATEGANPELVRFAHRFAIRRDGQPDIHGVQFPSGRCLFDLPEVGLGAAVSVEDVVDEPHSVYWPDQTSVVRPGDKLLVRLRSEVPLIQQQTVAERLRDRLPDVDVLVIASEGIHVYRPDTPGERQAP